MLGNPRRNFFTNLVVFGFMTCVVAIYLVLIIVDFIN